MNRKSRKVTMSVGGKKIEGFGKWKISTVPWYLKPLWWFYLHTNLGLSLWWRKK
jgi:hypothetical protein